MSFILDALKKSERARQRQAGPSLFEVKIAAPRRTLPAWAVILAMLLLINAAVVGWMMLGRPARRAAPAVSASSATDSSPQAHPTRAALSASAPSPGSPAAPQAAAGASTVPTTSSAAANVATRNNPDRTAGGSPPSRQPAAASAAGGTASDYAPAVEPSAQAGTSLPLYREVDSAPGKSLPSLHLDLHVYATDPDKRFVMINMHKLKQGDSLPDGVKVVSIRPDGVVLSYEGRRFLLPR